jgi:Cu/Ag efflux pump CusA
LGEVADVVEDHQPLIGDAIINGKPGLLLVVQKFPWGNTLEVTRGIDAALAALQPGLPGVEVDANLFRPATFIETATDNLAWILLAACILVIVALFVGLYEWRAALISLVAISLSLVTAVLVLYLLGAPMNFIVLAGLVVALGVVVDDAIIDVEKIVRRVREDRLAGSTRSAAAIVVDASLETRRPIIYATMIALLALAPLFFMTGLAGALLRPLAESYAVALLASLLVALTITPVLSLMLLDRAPRERQPSSLAAWLARRHEAVLTRIGHGRAPVLVAGALIILAGVAAWPLFGQSLLPEFKERDFLMHWVAPPGTSLAEMTRITTGIGSDLLSIPGVNKVASSLGRAVNSETIPGPYEAELWVSIDPAADYHQTVTRLQEVADGYPGVVHDLQTYLQDNVRHKLAETPDQITVRVYGSEEPVLREKAGEIAALVKEVPGVASALVGPRLEAPSIEIETDLAKVELHGLKPGDVRRAASALLGRIQVGSLFQDQKVFNVVVWGKAEVRNSLTDLLDLQIDTPDGGSVALSDVASVRIKPSEVLINRDAVSRYVDVGVTVRNRDAGAVENDIQQVLSQVKLPMEYHFEIQSGGATWGAARWRIIGPLIAAAALIFLLLQAALSSWRLALVVFVTLPAALVGGILVAALGGSTMSLAALTGLLAVFALSMRNDIALLRHVQSLAAHEPTTPRAALMRRAASGLAPPILTSAVVIAGALLPLVVAGNMAGLEILHALAAVVLGGLVTSTLLTLLILPVICANMNYSAGPDPFPE